MNHDVFISYSSKDQKIVEALSHYLEERGVRCFVAYRDIPKGKVWAAAITEAMENSQMMVVIFSDNFNNSDEVDREIEMCAEDKKPILTFKITDDQFVGAKKYYLKNINWIDAFPDPAEKFAPLYSNIKKLIVVNEPTSNTPTTSEPVINMVTENFACHIGKSVSLEMVNQAIEIDKAVYKEHYQGISDMCKMWWHKNPEIYVMIEDKSIFKIIGYINAMPLTDECYDTIISGNTVDVTLSVDNINSYDFPDIYKLYFASIAIHPDYHNTSAFKLLYDSFITHMLRLADREIYFSEVAADAVTETGTKMCQYLGMSKLLDSNHESTIYTLQFIPPKLRATTAKSRQLVSKYLTIFQ